MLRGVAECCRVPTQEQVYQFGSEPQAPDFFPLPVSTTPPPSPDADVKELFTYVVRCVMEDRSAAAMRHAEVLKKLSEHHKVFKEHLNDVHCSVTNLKQGSPTLDTLLALKPDSPQAASPTKDTEGNQDSQPDQLESKMKTPGTKTEHSPLELNETSLSLGQTKSHHVVGKSWGAHAQALVTHEKFEMVVAGMIMANAVGMCFEVQYVGIGIGHDIQYHNSPSSAVDTWPAADILFAVQDWVFGILFLMEGLLKMQAYGLKYFMDIWNWIDLLVVVVFIFDKGASLFMPVERSTIQLLKVLRLFRLIRLVRLLKTLEGLDVLYIMTTAIRGTTKILTWAVLLLMVMLCTIALFLSQALHVVYFADKTAQNMPPEELEMKRKLYEYFGSFTRCLLSMFELTLANWPPVTRLLAEEVSEWFMFLCVAHKLTIGFAVIGVINGVILQETFKIAATDDMLMVRQKKRATALFHKKMESLFSALEHGGDGELDFEEFQIIARVPEVKAWLSAMEIETDDLDTLFSLIDSDGSGKVPMDELVARIPRVKGPARSMDLLALMKRLHCDTTAKI